MKIKKLPLIAYNLILVSTLSFGQNKAKNIGSFNKAEYNVFVAEEQHQTVIEGEDAQFTVLLSRIQKYDIKVTYKIIAKTASLDNDIKVPAVKSFIIPAGKKRATIHIPTINDGISEQDEEFAIEIIKGINTKTKRKLNNTKLIRTRTIVDRQLGDNLLTFYHDHGTIKSNPAADSIEVRNFNGILIPNKNLSSGTYFINAVVKNKTITKTIIVN